MNTAGNAKSNIVNMTEGNPMKLILTFSLPMLVGNLFQQLYNLADSIIVGRLLGSNALAAVGATGSVTFMFFALCNGIASGGGIITSQLFGGGDDSGVKKSITNTGYIMLVFPIVVGTVSFILTKPLLRLLETPDSIMSDSVVYMQIMCVGTVFVAMYNYIASMLRALGDSKTPLIFLVVSCIINVFLDVFMVYTLDMGVKGAAVATIVSQFISGFACIVYAVKTNEYFKFTIEDLRFDKKITTDVIRLGVPLSLQFSLIAISCMALQKVVNSFGAIAAAAFTATSRIEQLIHQPYTTLGSSLSTYTGQNYGAARNDRVIIGYKKSLIIMVVFSAIMLPFMWLFGDNIMMLFVKEQEVIVMGATALRITSMFYAFLGVIYVVRGVLNGLGDAFFALLNGIVEVIGRFTVPIALTMIPAIGLWGIWWSVGVVWFMSGLTAWLRYLWYKKRLL